MVESDLALKGDIEGAELVIFPSSVLPEGQRSNIQL